MDALVTDAHIPSAVTGIRALGRAGLEVVALGPRRTAGGLWSRYAAARTGAPDAIANPTGFAAAVARAAERHGSVVIYPGQDESIDALLDARLPEPALLPYPGRDALAAVRDKGRAAELAAAAGLATPDTLAAGRADNLARGDLPDGAVVKPTHPGGVFDSVHVAHSVDELRAVIATAPADEELLLQERVTGSLMAVALVVGRDGELVRRFQQHSRRTWPEDAGISSLAVSVEPDGDLVEASRSLLAAAGYWGLAQLQFLDAPAGPVLIDVNTRFYGSLALALAAGVNLPAAWHAVARDRPAGEVVDYRAGVTYRWFEADVLAALRGKPRHLFSRAPRPRTGPMWASDDPLPSAFFTASAVAGPIVRRLRRR